MNLGKRLFVLGMFIILFVLIESAIILLTGLVSWLSGWRSIWAYSDALMVAGFLVIAFGAYGLMGVGELGGDIRFQLSQTVMINSIHERTKRNMLDLAQSRVFALVSGLCGAATVIIGLALKSLR